MFAHRVISRTFDTYHRAQTFYLEICLKGRIKEPKTGKVLAYGQTGQRWDWLFQRYVPAFGHYFADPVQDPDVGQIVSDELLSDLENHLYDLLDFERLECALNLTYRTLENVAGAIATDVRSWLAAQGSDLELVFVKLIDETNATDDSDDPTAIVFGTDLPGAVENCEAAAAPSFTQFPSIVDILGARSSFNPGS